MTLGPIQSLKSARTLKTMTLLRTPPKSTDRIWSRAVKQLKKPEATQIRVIKLILSPENPDRPYIRVISSRLVPRLAPKKKLQGLANLGPIDF